MLQVGCDKIKFDVTSSKWRGHVKHARSQCEKSCLIQDCWDCFFSVSIIKRAGVLVFYFWRRWRKSLLRKKICKFILRCSNLIK